MRPRHRLSWARAPHWVALAGLPKAWRPLCETPRYAPSCALRLLRVCAEASGALHLACALLDEGAACREKNAEPGGQPPCQRRLQTRRSDMFGEVCDAPSSFGSAVACPWRHSASPVESEGRRRYKGQRGTSFSSRPRHTRSPQRRRRVRPAPPARPPVRCTARTARMRAWSVGAGGGRSLAVVGPAASRWSYSACYSASSAHQSAAGPLSLSLACACPLFFGPPDRAQGAR